MYRKHSLDVEDSVLWVHGSLVLGCLTNKTLLRGERDERGGGVRTLLVGNDLHIGALVVGDARVSGTQVDANGTLVNFVGHVDVCGCRMR